MITWGESWNHLLMVSHYVPFWKLCHIMFWSLQIDDLIVIQLMFSVDKPTYILIYHILYVLYSNDILMFPWYSMILQDVPYLCTRLQHLEWVEAKCGCGYHGGKRQKNGSWDITDKSKLWLYRYYIYSFYIYQIFFKWI